jgi:uncharacterized protein with PIN domain
MDQEHELIYRFLDRPVELFANELLIFEYEKTGCSGFDSYFIALAKREDAFLFTADYGMHRHAEESGVNSILIRNHDIKTLERRLR